MFDTAATRRASPIARLDLRLHNLPQLYLLLGLFILESAALYLDYTTDPHISSTLFYLLTTYFAVHYIQQRWVAYVIALFSAVGKTYLSYLGGHTAEMGSQAIFAIYAWKLFSNVSVQGLFCYLLDKQESERRASLESLNDLSLLHKSIINATDSGILVFKPSGECVLANKSAARIIGFTVAQIRTYNFLTDGAQHAPQLSDIAQQVLHSGNAQTFDSPLRTVDGRDIWCFASISLVNQTDAPYLLVVFTDISAYQEAKQAMREARLHASIATNRAQVAERRAKNVSEETQRRIGQELHDDLGQHLTGIAFMSEGLRQKLTQLAQPEAELASRITQFINESISKIRSLSQYLYPDELQAVCLEQMLQQLAQNIELIYSIECRLEYDPACVIEDAQVSLHLFRIAQEAVNNACKHGHPDLITLRVLRCDGGNELQIADNGKGIAADCLVSASGLGMRTMQHRAELLGATLHIATPTEGGTLIRVQPAKEKADDV